MAPPPPVAYGAPQSTFWSFGCDLRGGAAVGGLLGYVWGDDTHNDNDDGWDDVEDAIRDLDDEDWDDFVDRIDEDDFDRAVNRLNDRDGGTMRQGGRDVNISDSTIVVGGIARKRRRLRRQAEEQARRQGQCRRWAAHPGGPEERDPQARGRHTGGSRGAAALAASAGVEAAAAGWLRPRSRATALRAGLLPVTGQRATSSCPVQRVGTSLPPPATVPRGPQERAAGQGAAQPGAKAHPQADAARRPGNQAQAAKPAVTSGIGRPREAQRAQPACCRGQVASGWPRPTKARRVSRTTQRHNGRRPGE